MSHPMLTAVFLILFGLVGRTESKSSLFIVPDPAQKDAAVRKFTIPGTKLEFEMASIAGGRAQLGGNGKGENPTKETEIRPFWIATRTVTWEEFRIYCITADRDQADGISSPSDAMGRLLQIPNFSPELTKGLFPATYIRWHAAMGYCAWLSKKLGVLFRLPTESELEFAARAGSSKATPENIEDESWYSANSKGIVHLVGQKKPNGFGLYDMMGNVYQYALEPNEPPGYGPSLKGAAWNSPPEEILFTRRQTVLPKWFEDDPQRPRSEWWLTNAPTVGFRIASSDLDADPKDRASYAEHVKVTELQLGEVFHSRTQVSGEVINEGDHAIRELAIEIYYVEPNGHPLLKDEKGRPTFNILFPVHPNSFASEQVRQSLGPKQRRKFALDVPIPMNYPTDLNRVGARVLGLLLAK